MRVLVLSDIHANLEALQAVLAAAGSVDALWCLGDVVGYGPDPNECVALLFEQPALLCLRGNHDAAAVGDLALDSFNPEARSSMEWQRQTLDAASIEKLKTQDTCLELDDVTLVHASPRQPILEYLLDISAAGENFAYFEGPYCFVGHTHIPVHFALGDGRNQPSMRIPKPNHQITLEPRAIINPGSVGQPRDRDPRAAFAIFDTAAHTWDYRRVEYDIQSVQQKMRALKLPARHIERIVSGW